MVQHTQHTQSGEWPKLTDRTRWLPFRQTKAPLLWVEDDRGK